jgi:hypothetical protein
MRQLPAGPPPFSALSFARRRLAGRAVCAVVCCVAAVLAVESPRAQDAEEAPAKNSTRKIRPAPSALAARAGEAVGFRDDLEAALAEAREAGRPVFWYVPEVVGSPMDRKPEIDRYAMAGPFSDPVVVALLRERFVPVRLAADRTLGRRFGVMAGGFLEPGLLVLSSEGEEVLRAHSIVTWSNEWLVALLRRALGEAGAGVPAGDVGFGGEPGLSIEHRARIASALRNPDAAAELASWLGSGECEGPADEIAYWRGAALFVARDEDGARAAWRSVGDVDPGSPWAFKAAAEAEGHGPFTRGFEVVGGLVAWDFEQDDGVATSQAPFGAFDRPQLTARGLEFLMCMQRSNGGFEDSRYDFGGTDSLPNVHVAVSAIVGRAWLRMPAELRRGVLGERLRELYDYLADDANLALADRDEILWAQAFRVRFFCEWARQAAGGAEGEGEGEGEEVVLLPDPRPHLERATAGLLALQQDNGAWFHEYPNPFVIATALVALADAADTGVEVPVDAVRRGLEALRHCRPENGAYTYSYPRSAASRGSVPAAAGRMPLGDHALSLFGAGGERLAAKARDLADLEKALRAAVEHYEELARVRKYDDHASRLGYGGFFFWFDLLTRAEAIVSLPPGSFRDEQAQHLRDEILRLPELDGCFVDSHELGRCYGTACALLSLALLDEVAAGG